jgi:hypothetical protein
MQEEPELLERYLMVVKGTVRIEVFLSFRGGTLQELLVTFPARGATLLGSRCSKTMQDTLDDSGLSWDKVFFEIEGWTDDRQKFVREHYLAAFLPRPDTPRELLHKGEVRAMRKR